MQYRVAYTCVNMNIIEPNRVTRPNRIRPDAFVNQSISPRSMQQCLSGGTVLSQNDVLNVIHSDVQVEWMNQLGDHLSGPTQIGSATVFLGESYSQKADTIALVEMFVIGMIMMNDKSLFIRSKIPSTIIYCLVAVAICTIFDKNSSIEMAPWVNFICCSLISATMVGLS